MTTTPHEAEPGPSPLVPRAGETITTFHDWTVHVTSTMCETYPLLRPALIAVALVGSKITYKGLAIAVNSPYAVRNHGDLLALVGEDCHRRGEPNLASLVVTRETGEPGEGWRGDAAAERRRCHDHWRRQL